MNVKLWHRNFILPLFISCIIERHAFSSVTSEAIHSSLKECRMYNWKSMACFWERYFIDGKEVHVTLKYKRSLCDTKNGPLRIEKKYRDCEWPSHNEQLNICHFEAVNRTHTFYATPHKLVLISDNDSLVTNSRHCLRDLDDIVQPNPATSLSVAQLQSNYVTLTWEAPHATKDFVYSVSYVSIWNDSPKEVNTSNLQLYLMDLMPHTTYKVTIRCMFNKTTLKGFWSDDAKINFTTLEDVPSAAPKLLPGSFMLLDSNEVKIMWQPIDTLLCNGILLQTRIRTISLPSGCEHYEDDDFSDKERYEGIRNSTKIINSKANRVLLNLDPDECHLIFIDRGTSVGFNDSIKLKPMILNSRRTGLSSIEIKNATVDKNGVFKFLWQNLENALSHTFYWCLTKDQMECETSFEFEIIPGNSSYFEKQLVLKPYQMIMFASSSEQIVNGQIIHSGWKIIPCIYNISSYLIKSPQNFHVVDSGSTWVTLEWNPIVCLDEYPSYFTHYEISYCYQPDCEDSEEIILPKDVKIHYVTVDELIPGTFVKFSIRRQLNDLHSTQSTITHALISKSWWSDISEYSLQVSLFIVGFFATLITIGVLLFCFKKFCEPMKIDVPECKESIIHPNYVITSNQFQI